MTISWFSVLGDGLGKPSQHEQPACRARDRGKSG
jgi:hypothetical protein